MTRAAPFLILALATAAHASDTNYQDFPLGQRAMGMGGAFVALADDPSATWYNPGGLGRMSRSSATASLSLYGIEQRVVSGGFANPIRTLDLSQLGFPILSTSLSAMTRFGAPDEAGPRNAIGISLFLPYNKSAGFRQLAAAGPRVQTGEAASVLAMGEGERTLWVGPSYARRFGSSFALGVSLFYDNRDYSRTFQSTSFSAEGRQLCPAGAVTCSVSSAVSSNTGSLFARLGAILRVDERWRFGVAFSTPSIFLHGGAEVASHSLATAGGAGPERYTADGLGDQAVQFRRPFELRVGGAYVEKESFTVAWDLSVHGPTSYRRVDTAALIPDPFFVRDVRREAVVNFNVGLEILPKRYLPLRVGAYTNFSSAPEIPERTRDPYLTRVHMYGVSGSIGYLGDGFGLDFGVNVAFGSGVTQTFDVDDPTLLRRAGVSHRLIYFFISGLGQALARSVQNLLKGVRGL